MPRVCRRQGTRRPALYYQVVVVEDGLGLGGVTPGFVRLYQYFLTPNLLPNFQTFPTHPGGTGSPYSVVMSECFAKLFLEKRGGRCRRRLGGSVRRLGRCMPPSRALAV